MKAWQDAQHHQEDTAHPVEQLAAQLAGAVVVTVAITHTPIQATQHLTFLQALATRVADLVLEVEVAAEL